MERVKVDQMVWDGMKRGIVVKVFPRDLLAQVRFNDGKTLEYSYHDLSGSPVEFKTAEETRAIIGGMDPVTYTRLREAYYQAACGLQSLVEELGAAGHFFRELEELRKVAKDFDRASGNLSAGL